MEGVSNGNCCPVCNVRLRDIADSEAAVKPAKKRLNEQLAVIMQLLRRLDGVYIPESATCHCQRAGVLVLGLETGKERGKGQWGHAVMRPFSDV